MNLFNSLPDKISPQPPSANIAPMTPDEAMKSLKKSVKLTQRGSLKKMKITSINPYIVYKYILNRYFKTWLKIIPYDMDHIGPMEPIAAASPSFRTLDVGDDPAIC